jgi:hypothetical protein
MEKNSTIMSHTVLFIINGRRVEDGPQNMPLLKILQIGIINLYVSLTLEFLAKALNKS